MKWILQITSGPRKEETFEISAGLTIGRRQADISLKDPKVSSKHVVVESSEDGRLQIKDNNSSNGVIYKNKRVTELDLFEGAEFRLGDTTLRIISGLPVNPTWKDQLSFWLGDIQISDPKEASNIQKADPPLVLFFEDGPLRGKKIGVFYTPMKFGEDGDVLLYEDHPSFTLNHNSDSKIEISASDKIKLNGLMQKTALLNSGDVLEVGPSQIKVESINGIKKTS